MGMGAEVAASSFLNFRSADFGLDKLLGWTKGKSLISTALHLLMPAHEENNRRPTPASAVAEHVSGRVASAIEAVVAQAMPVSSGIMRNHISSMPLQVDSPAAHASPVSVSSADQDRLLVQAALRGDESAFAELVTRYQTAVYNMASRMLGDPTDAEDAAQEVFVRAWNQLHTFQQDRRFSTWLLSIASHHCIDLLRRRKPSAPLDDVALYVESDDPEPDEIVLQDEQRDMVQALINALPEKYRAVTLLRYYGDMSYDEIAQSTGLSESAVKTQLHRARKMLADRLLASQDKG